MRNATISAQDGQITAVCVRKFRYKFCKGIQSGFVPFGYLKKPASFGTVQCIQNTLFCDVSGTRLLCQSFDSALMLYVVNLYNTCPPISCKNQYH